MAGHHWPGNLERLRFLSGLIVLGTCILHVEGTFVSSVYPHYGSLGGETRLTVYGSGFSGNQFSQSDDPAVGNRIYLVGSSGDEFSCPIHRDGTTTVQIMCYTPWGMLYQNYFVKVVVDNVTVPDSNLCGGNPSSGNCQYTPHPDHTPSIQSFTPISGMPGDFVRMDGRIFTDRYGSNIDQATNGRNEKLLRVYVGPQDCGLKNGDEPYGLNLTSDTTEYGFITCKTKGTSVGFFNASFIVEAPLGRSKTVSSEYMMSKNDDIYMYQVYTDITSLNPPNGSVAGGLTLTVFGNYFDNRAPYVTPKVYIEDSICDITKVELDQYIECTVAADPNYSKDFYRGNRGANFEYWTGVTKSINNINDILTLSDDDSGYNSVVIDKSYYADNQTYYVSRMTFLFEPPHTGDYEFILYGDEGARLFVDGEAKITSANGWGTSPRMALDASAQYHLQVIHYQEHGDSSVHLKAKFFNTSITNAWISKAQQERQTISISSSVVNDVQTLEFTDFTPQSSVQEIQTLEVNTTGSFRLGMFGVYTELLAYDADDFTVTTAFNALPVWETGESVTVTRNRVASLPTFTFNFTSTRGDFPDVGCRGILNGASATGTVTEDVAGVPDGTNVFLMFAGRISQTFDVSGLTANMLSTAVEGMFEAKCPAVFESSSLKKVYLDYESNTGDFVGTLTKDTEPFCGRYSLKNPQHVYRTKEDELGISVSEYKMVCFAYKGVLRNVINLKFAYLIDGDSDEKSFTGSFSHTFMKDSSTESKTWYYTCHDMLASATSSLPEGFNVRVVRVEVYKETGEDIFVDSLFIGRSQTVSDDEIYLRRLPPALPNGFVMETVSVTESAGVYTATLKPYECGYGFGLFELSNGDKKTGDSASPSSEVTYGLSNGGSERLTVRRTSYASPPVTGFIDITFNGTTRDKLNVSLTEHEFRKQLESMPGIGSLSVQKDGDCANFDMPVTFLTLPGDLPLMNVNYDELMGTNAAGTIVGNIDGGLAYDPLTGDMISTIHDKPQVRVFINDVPTKCSGDCTFEWSSASTPTVSSVTPTSGTSALSTQITISGTGFNSTISANKVTIGSVECTVVTATTTAITCDVGNGPVGDHKVVVNVANKGDADHGGSDKMFTYTADISGITPTSGSLGGGQLLTVTGYGFKSGAVVTINSNPCTVVTVTPAQLTCTVPASSSAGWYDVVIVQGSVTLSLSGYSYNSSLTSTVNTVSPDVIAVTGDTITIIGSSFGSTERSVMVGTQSVTVSSWSDTQIVIETGSLSAGVKEVKIETGNGYAVTGSNVRPSVNVQLEVTNVYPLQGSMQGGTILTITGNGFGTNMSLVDVDVGTSDCEVTAVTNTQVKCQISNAATVHHVTNGGTDRAFGVYYAFDHPYMTIRKGDFVTWSWTTPDFVNDVVHAIIQVETASSTTPMPGGFSSGTPTKNGQFTYQFNEVGEYFIWSGYNDIWNIKNYAGTVNVTEAQSSLAEVKVKMSGKEANYNVGGSSNPTDSSQCNTAKQGCSESLPTGGDSTKFNFAFWSCSTPTISSINPRNGTTQTDITILGEGFSSTCTNQVKIAGAPCTVTTSTATSITCRMEKTGEPAIGLVQALSLRVGNRGTALINIMALEDRSFALIPNIDLISPESGSLQGGALLTLSGFGLLDSPFVTVNGYQCPVVTNSYTEIVCETPVSSQQHTVDVVATVNIGGSPYTVRCETPSNMCKYVYSTNQTASISSINPDATSGPLSFSITGSGLGTNRADIQVTIGGEVASVTDVTDTTIMGTVQNLPVGDNDVVVKVKDYGKAAGSLNVSSNAAITSIVPSSGSIHGDNTITISGNGFITNQTSVSIGGSECVVQSVSLSQVVCITSAHAAENASVTVTSNSVTFPSAYYNYDTGSTPIVTAINPTTGFSGAILTITGENLGGTMVIVTLDNVPCVVTSPTDTQIICTAGSHETGSVPVKVHVSEYGVSNTNINFEYELDLSDINPQTGGIAGGQMVTLTGSGFESTATVTICAVQCDHVSHTTSEYICKTQAQEARTCDVVVTVNDLTETLADVYTYDASVTPVLSGVSPTRGGTGGGTVLTITGSGFGTTLGDVSVTIDGTACVASSVIDTDIVCVTGQHTGSIETKVDVEIGGNGIARKSTTGAANFQYVDVWSSNFTWGGGPVPQAGEFVVIPSGQLLLLDTDTHVLKFLLIQGGKLIFDNKDVELNSEIIMITDGGLLQVGTEAAPFQHKGIITLHGHHRSKELPIYGTKVLAVRNGTLDLHGIEVPIMWSRLAATSASGSTTLQLLDPVEWKAGDEIVIAATGHRHTQSENEKKVIQSVSADKMTLTLTTPLEAQHVGTEETFDGTLVQFRGEVGLLTHNVVVRGNTDPQWEDEIEACEAAFNTGEFATQTCFLGRFGDEIGSNQFGGMILVHSPVKDTQEARARLSYIEVTHAGQAFRLGRYPIHFHLNGEMSESYVRGVSIHHTFNRAVNIHGSHNTIIENTVIYNIMGGAFFLEDGIETGNTFQYNLAVFVRESSSLLNDDVTPASFWVTNPNNTIRHNAAAGGSHFGYWYRMHNRPDGPSFTDSVCPKQIPLGEFFNNTAHSFGWYGLWIFPDYFPKVSDCNGGDNAPAVFRGLFAWNNDKGAETVNAGALQFVDCTLVQNEKAGYEGKKIVGVSNFNENSPMVKDSLIVGTTTVIADSNQGCTSLGIILAYGYGFQIQNTRFVNFAASCAALGWASIQGTCSHLCGGFTYHTRNLTFINAPNRVKARWDWEGVIVDRDGSLSEKTEADWKVVPTTGTLPSDCETASFTAIGEPVSVCPPNHVFHRYAFNNPVPKSLEGKDLVYINQYGNGTAPYRKKTITHKMGWMLCLLQKETYKFEFKNAEHMTNISWSGEFYELESDDYLMITLRSKQFPDRVSVDGGRTFINATEGTLDPDIQRFGDWTWDNTNNEMTFLIHGSLNGVNPSFSLLSYKCFYTDCILPPDPDTVPPKERPISYGYWDDETIWNDTLDGYITNDPLKSSSYGLPKELDNVKVLYYSWIIVNMTSINKLGNLLLEGVLEFIDTPGANYEINVDFIIIRGGRLVIGTPAAPFQASASIILRGNHSSALWHDGEDGPTVGAKAIAVFGGLDLHGKDKGQTWTKLASTANAGDNQLVLRDAVGWESGDDIVVGPTSYNAWETESFRITAIADDGKTLTLNETLKFKHIAHDETITGRNIQLGAAVGLLSHNIKVIGEDYSDMYKESCGGRVLVGLAVHKKQIYTGYARVSNVEFYHMGQEGYTETYDPRFALAYVATGTVNDVKPSNVSKCSFHNGFNTAVGAFGIGGLNITDNVVFGSVGHALRTTSDDSRLINNMVALVVWTGTYQDRLERSNFDNQAGIEAVGAKRLILQGNLVTGSERFGFHVPPLDCSDTSDNYKDNMAQANVVGLGIYGALPEYDCVKYKNFMTWKSLDCGIYYQGSASFVGENNVQIEDGNGYHLHVLGPSALSHQTSSKTVEIKDGMVVGATSSFDCSSDVVTITDNLSLRTSNTGRVSNGGRIGIVFPNFMGGTNFAPVGNWAGIMTYPAISGLMKVKNMTFAHFKPSSCNSGDYAIATNPANDDGQHPVEAEETTFYDVNENNKIFYHRPNLGKINSADCVDMDCDGMKKCLFKDLDGTFLGSPGAVIPQSEYEWDGDPRRGLGDYRIPKEMVTELDGTRIPYSTAAPNKGIFRGPNCTFIHAWQAYKCYDSNYEMLIIESMDSDTESRRLSPVAIRSEGTSSERYIDLINGPQDHGWCSGYTCRKRISTFMAIVATEKPYLMHFTSTTPEHMRYHLLNVEESVGIKLTVWYSRPNRLDVFVNGMFVLATNARIENGNYILSMPVGNEFAPLLTDETGTNYFNRDSGELTVIIKGPKEVDVKTVETIIVSFGLPALTVEQFYGPNLIENIAGFFDIPLTKVRIVNVVSEQSNGRRRRSTTGIIVSVEIADEPSTTIDVTLSDSQSHEELLIIASNIMNECQAGNVSSSLNITGVCSLITVPPADITDPSVTYSTISPNRLVLHAPLTARYEGELLTTQPCIHSVDVNDVVISQLGTNEYPWQLSVTLRSNTGHPSAVLSGTTTVSVNGGWFNFTDLSISHMGIGYILDFSVNYPDIASNFVLESNPFDVPGQQVKANIKEVTMGSRVINEAFSTTLDLRDEVTNEVISDISWRSHTWSVTAKLIGSPKHAELSGDITTTFDATTGDVQFSNLMVTGKGVFYIQYNVLSTPEYYNITVNQKVITRSPSQVGMVIEDRNEIKLRFDVDYNTVLPTTDLQNEIEMLVMEEVANVFGPNVIIEYSSISQGSILIVFGIAGNKSDVDSTVYSLCDGITSGTTNYVINGYNLTLSPFLTVNNESFYGVHCGINADNGLSVRTIIGIAVGGAVIVALIIIVSILIWKYKIKPRTKTHNIHRELYKFTEDSFFTRKGSKLVQPMNTSLPTKRIPSANSATTLSGISTQKVRNPVPPPENWKFYF